MARAISSPSTNSNTFRAGWSVASRGRRCSAGSISRSGREIGSMPERFRAKWTPVRVKKTRQNKRLELRSDSIGTVKALARRDLQLHDVHFLRGRRAGLAELADRELDREAAVHDRFGARPAVAGVFPRRPRHRRS